MGRILLKICAVVMLTALSGPAAVYGQPVEPNGRDAAEGSSQAERAPPLAVTLIESEDQAKRGEERESKSDEHERLDLIAQQKAANAANAAAWLSGAGTFLIFLALIQTSLANMRQMRAYVGVDKIRVTENEKGDIEYGIVIKNFGQTPAYRFDGHCEMQIGDRPARQTNYPPDEIMPQHYVTMSWTTLAPVVPQIADGTLSLTIKGGGTYKDLAGRKRSMCFCMQYHHPTGSLIAYGGENRAD